MGADFYAPMSMLILLILSGTFSGAETALFSLSQGELSDVARGKHSSDSIIARLINDEHNLLLTILVTNNAVNICYFSIAAWWTANSSVITAYPELIIIGALIIIILFGEIFPKVISSSSPLSTARLLALPVHIGMFVCKPVVAILKKLLGNIILRETAHASQGVTDDEIKLVIEESRKHGVVSELIHDRLLEVIDLSTTPVHNVMTHRVDCASIEMNASEEEAREALKEHPGPFLIVYDAENNEECVGLLAAQDILKGGKVSKRVRKAVYIPSGANLPQAIALFQEHKETAGVVLDEYGGTLGLLTLAHIGQELLGSGDHEDLPDVEEPQQISEHTWLLSGLTPLEGWEALINDEDLSTCRTIGGFISYKLGSVPQVGDRLLYSNLLFQVESVDAHRIKQLRLEQLTPSEARRTTRNMEHL